MRAGHARGGHGGAAQTAPAPAVRVTFKEAIDRAIEKNPTVAAAASGILAAEGLIRQARAGTLFHVTSDITWTNLNRGVEFQGSTVTPQSQVTASVTAGHRSSPARRGRGARRRPIPRTSPSSTWPDTKRQVAFATADAFLTIITSAAWWQPAALEVARAHFDLATELERQGMGSRLNALRAQQQVSTDEGLVEIARLGVYRAQEALGVLIAVDGPVDASDVPDFPAPPIADQAAPLTLLRTDLKLFAAEEQTAVRIVRDSSKDYWPTIDALFSPSTTHPAQFFLPANSWRFLLLGNVPIFDSGQRAGTRIQREAAVEERAATPAPPRQAGQCPVERCHACHACLAIPCRSVPRHACRAEPRLAKPARSRQLPRGGGDQHRGHRCRARLARRRHGGGGRRRHAASGQARAPERARFP